MKKFLVCLLLLCFSGSALAQVGDVQSTESILVVDTYADLANVVKKPNLLVQTRGYSTASDGAGALYRYDSGTDAFVLGGSVDGSLAVVSTVVSLATVTATDETIYITRGYTTAGDGGGNIYRYDADSSATVDGGFVIDGPGSVGRYIAIKQDVINLLQWGLVPNDSSTAVANANTVKIEAARDDASTIYVPTIPGATATTWYLGDPIALAADERWVGDGKRKSKLAFKTYTGNCFVMARGASLESLTVDGISAASGMTGISCDGKDRCFLRDVSVANCLYGVHLDDCYTIEFYNVTVSGCTNGYFVPTASTYCNDIKLVGGELTSNTTAINVPGTINGMMCIGVTIQGNSGKGVYVGPYNASKRGANMRFSDCWFEDNGTHDIHAEGIVDNLEVSHNQFSTTPTPIDIGGGTGAAVATYISGNRYTYSTSPTQARIVLGANATKTVISLGYNVSDSGNFENITDGGTSTQIVNRIARTATSTDATPTVYGTGTLTTANGSATTITDLDDGHEGQEVLVLIDDANTTVDFSASSLKGNGGMDWSPGSGDHMSCTYSDGIWYCTISEN